jgi:hypothetical protein
MTLPFSVNASPMAVQRLSTAASMKPQVLSDDEVGAGVVGRGEITLQPSLGEGCVQSLQVPWDSLEKLTQR